MKNNTNLDEKLEGDEKFRAWKYGIMLILQENDMEKFVKEEVVETEEEEAKSKNNNEMIIANSIKDNLIPHISSRETPI